MKHDLMGCVWAVVLLCELALSSILGGEAPDNVSKLVEGNSTFAFDMYSMIRKEEGNVFFSPYSISAALAMTYAGARSNTAAEMQKAMHFTPGEEQTHPAFAALSKRLEAIQTRGAVHLLTANSLWPHKNYPFLLEYLSLLKTHYGAAITPLDYEHETESSRQVINKWVEDKTQDKIKNLIRPGDLDPLTRLVLVNAIYFKGNWETRFASNKTADATFHVAPLKTVETPLMTRVHNFKYAELDDLQIIELPYVGGELSMLVILPKEKNALGRIEDRFTKEALEQWMQRLSVQEVCVFLPKFKITWGTFPLNGPLKALGMVDAFSDVKACFSGMDGRLHWLYISLVLHKAFVDVNEEGTEAAAATAVVMKARGMPAPIPVFRADHPFLFLIQEKETGSILFMGRLTDPTQAN